MLKMKTRDRKANLSDCPHVSCWNSLGPQHLGSSIYKCLRGLWKKSQEWLEGYFLWAILIPALLSGLSFGILPYFHSSLRINSVWMQQTALFSLTFSFTWAPIAPSDAHLLLPVLSLSPSSPEQGFLPFSQAEQFGLRTLAIQDSALQPTISDSDSF